MFDFSNELPKRRVCSVMDPGANFGLKISMKAGSPNRVMQKHYMDKVSIQKAQSSRDNLRHYILHSGQRRFQPVHSILESFLGWWKPVQSNPVYHICFLASERNNVTIGSFWLDTLLDQETESSIDFDISPYRSTYRP